MPTSTVAKFVDDATTFATEMIFSHLTLIVRSITTLFIPEPIITFCQLDKLNIKF